MLLLEDLSCAGCRFASNGEWGISADAAAGALEDLAVFHARFEDAAERDRVAPWLAAPRPSMSEATSGLMRRVLDENAGKLTADYTAIGELYVEHHAWFDEIWHAGPATYIHGDTHIGNVFLDGDARRLPRLGLSRSEHTPARRQLLPHDVGRHRRAAGAPARAVAGLPRRAAGRGRRRHHLRRRGPSHRLQRRYTVVATFLAYMPSYAAGDGVGLGNAPLGRADAALEDLDVDNAVREALG